MYVEEVDLRCIDFVSFENYWSIMVRECRIIVFNWLLEIFIRIIDCKYLLEWKVSKKIEGRNKG
jgi:hypothetical protein